MPALNPNARQFQDLFGSVIPFSQVIDFASVADGDEAASDVTVPGAALGDFVLVAPSIDLVDTILAASVTAADTVTVVLANNTGGAVDLASQTVYGVVLKRGGAWGNL